jgi:hypothetical protein
MPVRLGITRPSLEGRGVELRRAIRCFPAMLGLGRGTCVDQRSCSTRSLQVHVVVAFRMGGRQRGEGGLFGV